VLRFVVAAQVGVTPIVHQGGLSFT
jgi:hypothetical protein